MSEEELAEFIHNLNIKQLEKLFIIVGKEMYMKEKFKV